MKHQSHVLYSKKTLEKYCSQIKITPEQRKAADDWLDLLDGDKLEKEKKHYFRFAGKVLKPILDYPIDDFDFDQNVEFVFTNDMKDDIVCFEAKGTKTKDLFGRQAGYNKKEQETPVKQTWDYMGKKQLEFGVCTNYNHFVLIDIKTKGYSKYQFFDFTSVRNNDEKLKEFIAIFSKQSLIDNNGEKSVKLYNDSLIEDREFTKEFYKLYHETRLMLKKEFEKQGLETPEAIHNTQLFLNRLIFLFFAEKNGSIPNNRLFSERLEQILADPKSISQNSQKVFNEIINLFSAFDKGDNVLGVFGFNGGLFKVPIHPQAAFLDSRESSFFSKEDQHSKLKNKISDLKKPTRDIIKQYKDKNLTPLIINLFLMNSFDFSSELNVNILGHIFEQSITDIQNLQNPLEKEKKNTKRKKEGIYYTFDYVTDYICRNTIIPYLSKNGVTNVDDLLAEYVDDIDKLDNKFRGIKILDLACGSGAFLVKAIDVLLDIGKGIQEIKEASTAVGQPTMDPFIEESEIEKIIENNIYGVDLNEESVEITKLSMFLKLSTINKKLIDVSKNIRVGNSLVDDQKIDKRKFVWEEEFPELTKSGFSVIIGNPPYGAEYSKAEQNYLKKKFGIGSSESAQLMIKKSLDLLSDDGFHGFIVPKSMSYASNWKKIQDLTIKNLIHLVDAGKVWPDVKLEQVVYILRNPNPEDFYYTGRRTGEILETETKIPKKQCKEFEFLINGVNKKDLELGIKIRSSSKKLGNDITNVRGAMIQDLLTDKGDTPVLGGDQIHRYCMVGTKGFVNKSSITDKSAIVSKDSILAQNLVAHIGKPPIDHIKITATIPERDDFIIVDTLNQIKPSNKVSSYFLLGLLCSKVVNWYTYRFIYAKAIRTMHFDPPVTKRIPIIVKKESEVVNIVKNLLKHCQDFNDIEKTFLENVKRTFALEKTNTVLGEFQNLEFDKFISEIKKLHGTKLSPSDEDEYMKYFDKNKKDVISLESQIKKNESDLNKLFYEIFDLNKNEIQIIEWTMPE